MADPLSIAASIIAVIQLSSTVLGYLGDVKDASADRISLIREINSTRGILSALNATVDDARLSDETWSITIRLLEDPDGPLEALKTILTELATTLRGSASVTGIKNAANSLRWPFKQSKVKKILGIIDRQKSTLLLALENDHIALSQLLCDNAEAVRDDIAGLSRELVDARLDAKTDAEHAFLNQLPFAEDAPFNSFRREYERNCLPETRVKLLNEITTWGNTPDGPCIFWLNGMAGTGKSTISRTVAQHFDGQGRLGASFFFSRGQGDLGHAKKFFTTIASQIAHALPALKCHICEAIANNYRIGTQGLGEQWRKLIFQPLSKLENLPLGRLPIVLVIDALDECEREDRKEDVRVILRLLAEAKDLLTIQLRIFLTSRPEARINDEFSAISKLTHQDFILHHISADIVAHDILIFIKSEFDRVRKRRGLPSDWPKAKDVNSLVQNANGLFIYAATICRFIDGRRPEKQLSTILQNIGSSSLALQKSATRGLDEMYSQVLKSSIHMYNEDEDPEELYDLFQQIVGAIVNLSDTLSATALTSLLSLPRTDVDDTLNNLRAVLDVPGTPDLPIRLLHPSFRDFLLDKDRCSNVHFWVDERQTHQTLADKCIRLMSNSLKQDVCRQNAPGTHVAEIESIRIEQCLPPEVKYACLYWIQHLQKSNTQLDDHGLVHQFLQAHLIHWLEALGWMGKTLEGIQAILSLEAYVPVKESPNLYAFIYDAKRFALYSRTVIEQSPLQLYCSALVFAPEKSIVRETFEKCIPSWIHKKSKAPAYWNAALQTLEGHSSLVHSVAFSPDSKQVVSGSGDRTVRLWDAATGASLQTLEGHSDVVHSVAFSPDGKQVVSGSGDRTVQLWDAATGALLQTLEGHSGVVHSVAFSPDSKQVVSGSGDRMVRLWDAATGALLQMLKGHSGAVHSVAFSPDSKQVVSGSGDRTVRLWDAATGALLQTLKGHSGAVRSVAFSPDSKQVVSGSRDRTVQLWDAATGASLQTLEGYSGIVYSVAFSPDGKQVVSGSSDQMVRLWDAATGVLLQTLEGHSGIVYSVAFSPDGKQVVSGSYDRTVWLWDATTGASLQTLQTLEGHSGVVRSVAFSLDGKQVVSGSGDQTVRLWDAATGVLLQTLEGHSGIVYSVAFSPDSKQVVSGSSDQMVRLWDAATGVLLQTLEGYSDVVRSVAFSPDSKQVVSGSYDQMVRLWDAATGALLQTLKGHSGAVYSVAFSPDSKQVVSGSGDQTVRLWDAATGASLQTLEGYPDIVSSVAFSPDSKQVVSGSYDQMVQLWDAATGALLQTLKGHSGVIHSVAFSPDGKQVVSRLRDRTVQLWDTATGVLLQTLEGYSSLVHSVAFSPDSKQVVSGSGDRTVQLWDAATGASVQTLEGHSGAVRSVAFSLDGKLLPTLRLLNNWVVEDNTNILWLPPDYRSTCEAVWEETIILGHSSGRLSYLQFRQRPKLVDKTSI